MARCDRRTCRVEEMTKLILLMLVMLISGCAATLSPPACPPQDSVVLHPEYGPLVIPEGFLDDSDSWKSPEEFQDWMQELFGTNI